MCPTRILFFKLNTSDPFNYLMSYNFQTLHHLHGQHPSKTLVPRAKQTFLLVWYSRGCECDYVLSKWLSREGMLHEHWNSDRVLGCCSPMTRSGNPIIKEICLILDAFFLVSPCRLLVIPALRSRCLVKYINTRPWFQVTTVNIKYLLLVSKIHLFPLLVHYKPSKTFHHTFLKTAAWLIQYLSTSLN